MTNNKIYLTVNGAQKMRDEIRKLLKDERPKLVETISWAAGNGDRSENGDYIYGKKRLREIDKRLRILTEKLDHAEVVDPTQIKADDVRFGATVTLCDEEDQTKTYTLVGSEEVDPGKGLISYKAPLARAIWRKKVGDVVSFMSPKGELEYEIMAICYQGI